MRPIPGLVLTAALVAAASARAAEPVARYDPRTAFAEADTTRDGAVDRGEFNARIVEVFYFADSDKDGWLSAAEEQRLAFPEDFRAADRDANGRISLREFLRIRFAAFDRVDTDEDGVLSLAEVTAAFEDPGRR